MVETSHYDFQSPAHNFLFKKKIRIFQAFPKKKPPISFISYQAVKTMYSIAHAGLRNQGFLFYQYFPVFDRSTLYLITHRIRLLLAFSPPSGY